MFSVLASIQMKTFKKDIQSDNEEIEETLLEEQRRQ